MKKLLSLTFVLALLLGGSAMADSKVHLDLVGVYKAQTNVVPNVPAIQQSYQESLEATYDKGNFHSFASIGTNQSFGRNYNFSFRLVPVHYNVNTYSLGTAYRLGSRLELGVQYGQYPTFGSFYLQNFRTYKAFEFSVRTHLL